MRAEISSQRFLPFRLFQFFLPFISVSFPDAAQHEVVRRCSGIVPNSAPVTIPGLQRIIALRFMLRCARETAFIF
jgi:hypothetical protein